MRRYYSGNDLSRVLSIAELAEQARRRLPHFAWEYLEGGAEDELTLRRNRQAFAERDLQPRTLVPCARVDSRCTLFGRKQPLPLVIGPTGYNGMLHLDADIHLARAANARGLPFTLSTVSTTSLEDLAKAVPGLDLWFQLYCLRQPGLQNDLLSRAAEVGCKTLLLTTDAVLLGNREWDRRNFVRPGHLSWRNKLDVLRHPRWAMQTLWPRGIPQLANLLPYLPAGQRSAANASQFVASQMHNALDWEALANRQSASAAAWGDRQTMARRRLYPLSTGIGGQPSGQRYVPRSSEQIPRRACLSAKARPTDAGLAVAFLFEG